MGTFQEFVQGLRDALLHLYDPGYPVPQAVLELLGLDPQEGLEPIQAAILEAVEGLKPASSVPACARGWRMYEVLSCRYVQKLTQEQTAERLGITPRHLRREQRSAINALAKRLREKSGDRAGLTDEPRPESQEQLTAPAADTEMVAWRSQVRQELAVLQKSAPGSVADVAETIRGIVELVRPLTSARGAGLELGAVEPGLVATIHPSELRQVLVATISRLARNMSSGSIELCAAQEGGRVKITVTGDPVIIAGVPGNYLTDEVLARLGGSIQLQVADRRISFHVDLPTACRVTVLVVDDNADLVHFYKRYVLETRYSIVTATEGQRVFEIVEAAAPDIVVLDVMLPDVDGWELLAHLRQHPLTRLIPVIVCSVVREEELSLALGAALYVPKPVRRAQFLQALDQVLNQAAAGAPRARLNSAPAC